ncbi:MAG TPA: DUF1858 domain-containing protein [Candidatus Acidoferrales bacterium]|jgi:hypothetical protein|nr:DUF1858 domain-containing protein [Candidatus Acidoferrales bacterium]
MPDSGIQKSALSILPSTKVAALLDEYPQLEELLITLAPPFQKLKNPILRKTTARVASLEQVAQVGRISLPELVNQLRAAVGQTPWNPAERPGGVGSYFAPQPEWFSSLRIVATINEQDHDPNKMPLATILERVALLKPGDIVELRTSFIPAPGIDLLKGKKLLVWTMQDELKQIRTYICKTIPGDAAVTT